MGDLCSEETTDTTIASTASTTAEPEAVTSGQGAREPSRPETTSWWRKPLVWAGGAGTLVIVGVLTGVLVNVLTPPVQRLTAAAEPTAAVTPPNDVPTTASASKPKPHPTPTTPPLSVVSEDPLNGDDLGVWAFPSKIPFSSAQLAHANELSKGPITGLANYFFSLGGYAMNVDTQLVLQNDSSQPVSILDLRVVKNCGSPLTGTLFDSPPQGSDDDVRIGFDLDSADTDAESAAGWNTETWKPDYFESKFISFRPGEQRVLNIRAVTKRHACTFTYQATVLEGKAKFYQTIDDGGQPFRVTALVDTSSKAPFARYAALYAGGVLTAIHHHGEFVKENPRTYPGSG